MPDRIYPCLWFEKDAIQAAQYYVTLFTDSKIVDQNPTVVTIELMGQRLMLLNGGAEFRFNPSISMSVGFKTAAEVENLWDRMIDEGGVLMPLDKYPWSEKYGWLHDKYGLTWQISFTPEVDLLQPVVPSMLFVGDMVGRTEEAVQCYTSIFPDSHIGLMMHYEEGDTDKTEFIKQAQFTLNGYKLTAMDSSAPHKFNFNEAVSLVVPCRDQAEIDYYWEKLLDPAHGEGNCGWLKDKFGVSWQIVPAGMGELTKDPKRAQRVFQALRPMTKLIIQDLENA